MPHPNKVTFVSTADQYVWRVYEGEKIISERIVKKTENGASAEKIGTLYDDLGKDLTPLSDAINACPVYSIMRELSKLQEAGYNF